MSDNELSRLLHTACDAAGEILHRLVDRSGSGERNGQYALDLAVDGPLIELLQAGGLGVLSEEAGAIDLGADRVAVLDPVDGSTNASLFLPWYATSICVVDEHGPLHSMVVNHGTGTRYEAVRGGGATRDGVGLERVTPIPLAGSVMAVNGAPPPDGPWAQFRCFGASALDLSALAAGQFGAYVDFDVDAHGVWDYLGAQLVCTEVGVLIVDAFDRDLVVLEHDSRRTPVAATTPEILEELVALRRSLAP
jgi:myo-inositol-1(or 4)-monophosphatase